MRLLGKSPNRNEPTAATAAADKEEEEAAEVAAAATPEEPAHTIPKWDKVVKDTGQKAKNANVAT